MQKFFINPYSIYESETIRSWLFTVIGIWEITVSYSVKVHSTSVITHGHIL